MIWPFRTPNGPSSRGAAGSSRLVIAALLASMVVAGALAVQAIEAARERRAIGEAMLRQYAQLAASEFSRLARRDVEQSLMHTLQQRAHPGAHHRDCDCDPIANPEEWLQVTSSGELRATSDAVRSTLASLARPRPPEDGGGTAVTILPLAADPARFVAMRPEPHLPDGGQVGLVSAVRALTPAIARAHNRGSLLPAVLAGNDDNRRFVHLRIVDAAGATVFASPGTTPGPYVVASPLLAEMPLSAVVETSMTPVFIAEFGPTPGTLRTTMIVVLVIVNALLMIVSVWQLRRERELTRLRADFVAGVSHELRTPLAQIRMFSETLLLNRIRSADEQKRALEIIGQESNRLSHLVDNVLLFHGGGGDRTSTDASIDLNAFVHEVVESFTPLAKAKAVDLVVTGTDDTVHVRGEAGALRQVLLNLLDNAVKFGPAGQTVTVHCRREAGAAILTVEDGGSGIPVADRYRIFNAFQRGQNVRGTGGAGIGLAVVQQIVTAHRGSISVDDTPGPGARFRVELPAVDGVGSST